MCQCQLWVLRLRTKRCFLGSILFKSHIFLHIIVETWASFSADRIPQSPGATWKLKLEGSTSAAEARRLPGITGDGMVTSPENEIPLLEFLKYSAEIPMCNVHQKLKQRFDLLFLGAHLCHSLCHARRRMEGTNSSCAGSSSCASLQSGLSAEM